MNNHNNKKKEKKVIINYLNSSLIRIDEKR